MDKQEAIERVNELTTTVALKGSGMQVLIDQQAVLEVIDQINEPQKPVVPKFVAEWIEENRVTLEKYVFSDIQVNLPAVHNDNPMYKWLDDKGIGIIVDCIRNGYEVEYEQLYTVEIPDPNASGYSIVLGRKEGKVIIKQVLSTTWKMNCSNQLTESEIKQDFEWAWQFAERVEVE